MEKNVNCVSTTPEQMYAELQAEKKQRAPIKPQQSASISEVNTPQDLERPYGLIQKKDKCIIYKRNGKSIKNGDICFSFMWQNADEPFVEYAKKANLLSTEDISLESNFISALSAGNIIYYILVNYRRVDIRYLGNMRILELDSILENCPEFPTQNLLSDGRKKLISEKLVHEKDIDFRLKNLTNLADYEGLFSLDDEQDQLKVWEWPTAPKLLLALAKNGWLSEKAQIKAFELPNASEIILILAKKGLLCYVAQLKIFEWSNAAEIILEQAKNGSLSNETQLKAFELPNASEIILEQAKKGFLGFNVRFSFLLGITHIRLEEGKLGKDAQLKALELPNAPEIILEQAKIGGLYNEAQLKIFELPNASEIILALIETRYLDHLHIYFEWTTGCLAVSKTTKEWICEDAILKACELPNASEVILALAEKGYINDQVQLKICELPNAPKVILKLAQKGDLCNDAQLKALELPNAPEIILALLKREKLCEEALCKFQSSDLQH